MGRGQSLANHVSDTTSSNESGNGEYDKRTEEARQGSHRVQSSRLEGSWWQGLSGLENDLERSNWRGDSTHVHSSFSTELRGPRQQNTWSGNENGNNGYG